jgi:hypothetical protein
MKAVEWVLRQLRSLGPYLAIELFLPGGSIVALVLWTYRHRTAAHRMVVAHKTPAHTTATLPTARCTA